VFLFSNLFKETTLCLCHYDHLKLIHGEHELSFCLLYDLHPKYRTHIHDVYESGIMDVLKMFLLVTLFITIVLSGMLTVFVSL